MAKKLKLIYQSHFTVITFPYFFLLQNQAFMYSWYILSLRSKFEFDVLWSCRVSMCFSKVKKMVGILIYWTLLKKIRRALFCKILGTLILSDVWTLHICNMYVGFKDVEGSQNKGYVMTLNTTLNNEGRAGFMRRVNGFSFVSSEQPLCLLF